MEYIFIHPQTGEIEISKQDLRDIVEALILQAAETSLMDECKRLHELKSRLQQFQSKAEAYRDIL